MPCQTVQGHAPVSFISLPPFNAGLPIPLFDMTAPADGRPSINTPEGWSALVERRKKKAAPGDCSTKSGGDRPQGQSEIQDHDKAKEEKSQAHNQLREKRLAAGLTTTDLAKRVGVCSATVCQWELGKWRPRNKPLRLLAEALQCTAEELGYTYRPENPVKLSVDKRNELVEENLKLIDWVISQNLTLVIATRMEWPDLHQDLAIRLIQAVDTFNPTKGKLKSHIIAALKGEIRDLAKKASAHGLTHAPRDLHPQFSSIEALMEAGIQFVDGRSF